MVELPCGFGSRIVTSMLSWLARELAKVPSMVFDVLCAPDYLAKPARNIADINASGH